MHNIVQDIFGTKLV